MERPREALGSLALYLWKRWSSSSKIWVKRIRGKEHHRVPWEKLSDDIWSLIFQRLPLVDRIHAGPVCKQWFSTIRQTPTNQPVWVLLPYDKDCMPNEIRFIDLCDGTVGKLKFPDGVHAVIGTCKGWFILLSIGVTMISSEIPTITWKTSLFDPISRGQIALPRLSSIPSTLNVATFNVIMDISSKDASSQSVVAACFDNSRILALCRPKDESWTVFNGLDSVAQKYKYVTIRFCHGILYAFVAIEDEEGDNNLQFQTSSMKLADERDVTLRLINLRWFMMNHHPAFLREPFAEAQVDHVIVKNFLVYPKFVESNGELLMIVKTVDALIIPHRYEADDNEDEPLVSYFRTAGFEVFKLQASDDTHTLSLTRQSNLDEQTLFLDGVNMVSIPAAGRNFSKNCIYFMDDAAGYTQHEWIPMSTSRESGVFYLNDGRINRSFPSLDLKQGSRYYWFFPTIKIA